MHAGEGRPPDEIRVAIEQLHALRIGHGTTLLDDPSVLDLVLERGVTIEACPTSNWQVGVIGAVAEGLAGYAGPVVLDPVMVAKSGDALLADEAVSALAETLLPRAAVLTPNLPEAARLLGAAPAAGADEMIAQGEALLRLGPKAVYMKGGHGAGADCVDFLVSADAPAIAFRSERIATRNTHGTGCSLSSAIAAEMAKGQAILPAVTAAHAWLHQAIREADTPQIGHGHGPVHHFHGIWP